ncbi:MAG: sulfotransferase [Bauldia sp.]|nr:sulfotransferase [Bauldia sp.]
MSTLLKTGPDFIIIGAHRSGTTWLHRAIGSHPSVWVPPVKELHFFDDPTNKRFYVHLRKRLKSNFAERRLATQWDLRYFFGRRNDHWYRSLFEPGRRRGKVTGEATPSYSTLGAEGLEHIKTINTDIKLIYIMRDPVERMWSAIRNAETKNKERKIKNNYDIDSERVRKSSYLRTIVALESHFRPDQLFFGFFDDIKRDPERLVADVLRFIGVEPGDVGALLPKGAVNSATGSSKPPPEFVRGMAALHLPWLRKMCERFPGPPEAWRDRYEALLSAPSQDTKEAETVGGRGGSA